MVTEKKLAATNQGLVAAFYYDKLGRLPTPAEARAVLLEELGELSAALALGSEPTDTLKELADVLYVCYGYATANGWNLTRAFQKVHASNMTKEARDTAGKVRKGAAYVAPDLGDCIWSQ